MWRLAEAAIIEAAKVERNSLWREANQFTIDTYTEFVLNKGIRPV